MMIVGVVMVVVMAVVVGGQSRQRGDTDQNTESPNYEDEVDTTALLDKIRIMFEKDRDCVENSLVQLRTELKREVETVKSKVETMAAVVDTIATQLTLLATHDQLVQEKTEICTLITSSNRNIEATLKANLPVREDEILANQVKLRQEVSRVMLECGDCAQADTVAQVLTAATTTQNTVTHLNQQLVTVITNCTQGCEEEVVRSRGSEECAANSIQLTNSVAQLETTLGDVQHKINNIHELTRPRPPPPSPTPEQDIVSGENMSACEDSTFVGRRSLGLNVCMETVRFRKCQLPEMAYHCCHSCTTQGQIPENGPWRYLSLPRRITRTKALKLMRQRPRQASPPTTQTPASSIIVS